MVLASAGGPVGSMLAWRAPPDETGGCGAAVTADHGRSGSGAGVAPTHTALRHDALIYGSDDEFTAALVPFVEEGLGRGDAVVAVTTPANIAALGDRLGARSRSVEFVDAGAWYQAPARTIAGYRAKLDEALGAGAPGVRVIGEVAFGDDESDHRDWSRYESVLNRVFADAPAWIVCPYDSRRLPSTVVDQAARTHPHLFGVTGRRRSEAYLPPEQFVHQLPAAGAEPPPDAAAATLAGAGDLRAARTWLREHAVAAGLAAHRLEELLVAAGEVMTNALVHGRPPVRVCLWRSGDDLNVQIADSGAGIHDPLAGFEPPAAEDLPQRGMGLWLARQFCRAVEILPGRGGARVHLTVPL